MEFVVRVLIMLWKFIRERIDKLTWEYGKIVHEDIELPARRHKRNGKVYFKKYVSKSNKSKGYRWATPGKGWDIKFVKD